MTPKLTDGGFSFGGDGGFASTNIGDRRSFVKKTLGILWLQLTVTFIGTLTTVLYFHGLAKESVEHREIGSEDETKALIKAETARLAAETTLFCKEAVWISMVMSLVILVAGTCSETLTRKSPHNMIFLMLWTSLETHLVAYVSLHYDPMVVTMALGVTAAICFLVIMLVQFTSFDFSQLLPVMMVILLGWCIVLFSMMILGLTMSRTLYACIAVAIFTVFLVIDVKMLIGDGRYEFDEEDYIFAAINIYLDIINIFLYVLEFLDN